MRFEKRITFKGEEDARKRRYPAKSNAPPKNPPSRGEKGKLDPDIVKKGKAPTGKWGKEIARTRKGGKGG